MISDAPGTQIPQLVWESEYEPYILLDLNAMAIKKSWSIAPFANSDYGSFDKQSRPAHRFESLDFPVLGHHGM